MVLIILCLCFGSSILNSSILVFFFFLLESNIMALESSFFSDDIHIFKFIHDFSNYLFSNLIYVSNAVYLWSIAANRTESIFS